MPKIDLKKQHAALYQATAAPKFVEAPSLKFLMVDGRGAPGGVEFQEAVQAVFGVAFSVKFAAKKAGGDDFVVAPLEGLWAGPDGHRLDPQARDAWTWTLMIAQPEAVSDQAVADAVAAMSAGRPLAALQRVRLERFDEGLAAQVLHVGPYDQEVETLERLHEFIAEQGYVPRGRHHEIYLSDPRRTAPDKLRTILRQGVRAGPAAQKPL